MCRKCYGVYIFVILQISLAQCVESVMVYTYLLFLQISLAQCVESVMVHAYLLFLQISLAQCVESAMVHICYFYRFLPNV